MGQNFSIIYKTLVGGGRDIQGQSVSTSDNAAVSLQHP